MRFVPDRDAVFTLLLSKLVLLLSGGLYLAYLALRVLRTARGAPTAVPAGALVLVLGHQLDTAGRPSPDFQARLRRAAECRRGSADCRLLLLGGVTRPGQTSEAAAGARFLREGLGVDGPIEIEDASRHTLENLRNALPQIAAAPERPLVLLSSRYHLARALIFAETMGLQAQPCAAEPTLRPGAALLWQVGREALYLHWYLIGLFWARSTGNARMLARLQ